jgi:hypothetical protein
LFTQAYNDKINSASVTGTTTKTLTLTQQDGGEITASWTDLNTDAVISVFGRTGAVVAANGDYTTAQVTESGNLYFTQARVSANTDVAANTAARHNAVTLGTANGLSLSTQVLSLGLASAGVTGALSGTDWSTFNSKQNALTLTTTGTSGAATLVGSTLNIPQYQAAGTYVTSVTASSPLFSSGGTTPNITIQQASGSQSGFLSSTDWTTFNNKQNALTNPVTGTGNTNYLSKFTSNGSTIGNSQIIDDATRVGIGVSPTTNKLEVGGSITVGTGVTGNTDIRFNNATNGKIHYVFSDSASGELGIEAGASVGIKFNTNGANTRMAIFSDGNVTIGNSPSNAGFKLDVNGTGRFSGVVTTTNKYVSTVGNNNIVFESLSATTGFQYIQLLNNTAHTIFGIEGTGAGSLLTGGSANASVFTSVGNTNLEFGTNQVKRLTIAASTGAATFSSSVTAASIIRSGGTSSQFLKADGSIDSNTYVTGGPFLPLIGGTLTGGLSGTSAFFSSDIQTSTRLIASNPTATIAITASLSGTTNRIEGTNLPLEIYNFNTEIRLRAGTGSAQFTLTTGGNVLIGTTTDTGNDRRLQVAGNLFVDDNATTGNGVQLKNADRPLITRGWDAFTSGNKTGVGRWGVYMESAELFIGSPGTDYTGGLVTIGGWLVNGTRQPNLTVNNQTRNVTATGSITATSFFESSDSTIKTLVEDAYQAKGIDSVVAKLYIKNGKQELGYYAQDLEGVLPSAVNKGSDGLLNLSYREVHTAKIAYLEEEIRQIKKRYEIN